MSKFVLGRRALLRGVGAGLATLALPPLEAMLNDHGTAHADGSPLPKRFGVWFWADGVLPERWLPAKVGADWALSEQLMPFVNVKNDLNVVSGYDVKSNGQVHHIGTSVLLSGSPYKLVRAEGSVTTFAAPSIDVVAKRAIGATALKSIEIGVDNSQYQQEGTTGYVLSHNGPDDINPPIYSPAMLFDRLFGGGLGSMSKDAPAPSVVAAGRKSVLDSVTADLKRLNGQVGAADRTRLDQHLTGVRALEARIAAMGSMTSCTLPTAPEALGPKNGLQQHRAVSQAMSDLLALAMACDVTRVFSFRFAMWHTGVFGDIGATNDWHTYTHDESGAQPMVGKHVVFAMQQLAYLLEKLKGVPVGAGTLLDQCAILGMTEVQRGQSHQKSDMPVLLAGRAGGALRTGMHHRGGGDTVSRINLTALRAVGVKVDEFGSGADRATAEISALRA